MCGICGILGFEDRKLLKNMCRVISHRGPDDSGIYLDKDVGLGHRRLSIIDLKTGRQPVHNEDESIWIVYNGEIYNYRKLKGELEKRGHKFYTNTDTEVIIHLYEEGPDFVKRLRGMFAFAIWDSNRKTLIMARDHMGIKPLYYAAMGNKLLFASEIKSILQYGGFERRMNYRALDLLLGLQCVPGSETMFEGIKKLPPGFLLTCRDGRLTLGQYWDLEMKTGRVREEGYYTEQIIKRLEGSVESRLMSDVPLGAFLSGGVDSSTVVALMSRLGDGPVKTFSLGFGESSDELKHARIVSDFFGTEHREIIADPERIPKMLPELVWHYDEPPADSTTVPVFLLSEKAKREVSVVLTGEGGDEVFAGYRRYKILSPHSPLRFMPKRLRLKLYFDPTFDFTEGAKKRLYSGWMASRMERNNTGRFIRPFFEGRGGADSLLNRAMYFDIKTWLPEFLLMKVDKMTMAHGLEARVPILDKDCVEFACSIPLSLKLRGPKEKYILRKSVMNLLPADIPKRKKQSFLSPLQSWFGGDLGEAALQILSEKSIARRGYFNYRYVRRIIQRQKRIKILYPRRLWLLLMIEMWHRIFLDGDNVRMPNPGLNDFC